ncbi:MAG TPA: hypothetical protein PKN30_08095 [Flavobacteriales bacterium]|nr:hypothetical protein [Flavobacteriales bacterium]
MDRDHFLPEVNSPDIFAISQGARCIALGNGTRQGHAQFRGQRAHRYTIYCKGINRRRTWTPAWQLE